MAEVRVVSWQRGAGKAALHVAVAAAAISFLFPFFWMISNAVRSNGEVLAVPPRLLPSEWQPGNFIVAWFHLPFGRFFLNSTLVAGSITLITLVISCLAGYAFARMRFAGRDSLFIVYVATLMVPQSVLVIPLFLMMSRLGWVNTYQGLILPVAFGSFGTFLMRQFFLSIPIELEEAAMIDGATSWQRFWRIKLPLISPTLFFGIVLTAITSLQVFDQVYTLTRGGPGAATQTLGYKIYRDGFISYHFGYASAIAWILFVIIMALTAVQLRLQRQWVHYDG